MRSNGRHVWNAGGACRMRRLSAAVMLAIFAAVGPLHAGDAQERLFAVGILDAVPTGQRLIFRQELNGSFDAGTLPPIEDGELAVTLTDAQAGGREAMVTQREDGIDRPVVSFPAGAGHPMLLFFLETTVRDLAVLTGGSPFYIRNRVREALGAQDEAEPVDVALDGGSVTGERLVFHPFTQDPNRSRLGKLADLEIRVTVSDAVPGGFARLEAVAPPDAKTAPAFSQSITFEHVEEE